MGEGQQEEIPCEIPGWAPMAWLVIPAVTIRYDTVCFGMVHIRIVRVCQHSTIEAFQLQRQDCGCLVAWWPGSPVLLRCKAWK